MKPDNNALALALLASVAATINAVGVLLEAEQTSERVPATDDGGICRHPEGKRISTATAGKPTAWMCGNCEFQADA